MIRPVREALLRAHRISMTLFRLMIPVILLIRLLEQAGVIEWLSLLLEPLMHGIGLPGEAALVWATTMMINLYGGLIVLASLWNDMNLSVAQATVLATLMLLAHSLPVEGRIAQRAGVNLAFTLALRIGMALLLALMLHHLYQAGGFLQQPATLLWQPEPAEQGWWPWLRGQVQNLAMIYGIILLLILLLEVLQRMGVIDVFNRLLRPLLQGLGIGREAETLTLVGLTLGLSYGGALLIEEAEAGRVAPADVLYGISLLGLSHSLIEDTLLLLLIGADLTAILLFRFLFTLLVIFLMVRVLRHWPARRLGLLVRPVRT